MHNTTSYISGELVKKIQKSYWLFSVLKLKSEDFSKSTCWKFNGFHYRNQKWLLIQKTCWSHTFFIMRPFEVFSKFSANLIRAFGSFRTSKLNVDVYFLTVLLTKTLFSEWKSCYCVFSLQQQWMMTDTAVLASTLPMESRQWNKFLLDKASLQFYSPKARIW